MAWAAGRSHRRSRSGHDLLLPRRRLLSERPRVRAPVTVPLSPVARAALDAPTALTGLGGRHHQRHARLDQLGRRSARRHPRGRGGRLDHRELVRLRRSLHRGTAHLYTVVARDQRPGTSRPARASRRVRPRASHGRPARSSRRRRSPRPRWSCRGCRRARRPSTRCTRGRHPREGEIAGDQHSPVRGRLRARIALAAPLLGGRDPGPGLRAHPGGQRPRRAHALRPRWPPRGADAVRVHGRPADRPRDLHGELQLGTHRAGRGPRATASGRARGWSRRASSPRSR